ncbi:MAG: hypothetical protein PHQ23_08765 [Candidatus Wallbacteria bacterium]|nr:hypothetical protein [Candidatus Wallbacteria bacterium]
MRLASTILVFSMMFPLFAETLPVSAPEAAPATQGETRESETKDKPKWLRFENETAVICLLFDPGISFHYMKLSKNFGMGSTFFEYCAFYPGRKDKDNFKGSLATLLAESTGYHADGTFYYKENQNTIGSIDISKDPQYVRQAWII